MSHEQLLTHNREVLCLATAVFDGAHNIPMVLQDLRGRVVQAAAVDPVVVNRDTVFEVDHLMPPPTRNEERLPFLLHDSHTLGLLEQGVSRLVHIPLNIPHKITQPIPELPLLLW
eukprot:CAMPEP_0206224420 /NCGR_PEP_ID=MMETSP0047_2-20121206/7014_1 /ASSEMBLY_ACC=CAM_ASM_000192 /TAXON_ID=195065 /ORGANISM="Chroomonas mesostigmatica_cf, Strain CCMP1168" /LENGTH=114 /DNA_ID=CAMNT_0053647371 /DNA_START=191 /DNA_END=532 /DNA_ORIENTATION=+